MEAIVKRKYVRKKPLAPRPDRKHWTLKPTIDLAARLEAWRAQHPGQCRSDTLYRALDEWLTAQEQAPAKEAEAPTA